MSDFPHDQYGNTIFPLSRKLDALRYCMIDECMREGPLEDAMGHLMDLIHHIAPEWKFCGFDGIAAIAAHYGQHPTPIKDDNWRDRFGPSKLSFDDYERLIAWFRQPDATRKPADLAFSAGVLRDVARAFEAAQQEIR